MQCVDQDQLGNDDRSPLEVDCLPAVVVEVLHIQQGRLDVCGSLRHEPLKVGEEWGIVQSPF
jgi:hypothetical protein